MDTHGFLMKTQLEMYWNLMWGFKVAILNLRYCEYGGEFCAIRFPSGGLNGVGAYTGTAIAFYFPGDNVNANCFAYYIFDTDDKDVRIGNNTSGC